jgi:hypothetical protein
MHSLPPFVACSSPHLFGKENYSKDVCFMFFVYFLPFCSCLFIRMRGRNLLLRHDECHHPSISTLTLHEQNSHEITPPALLAFSSLMFNWLLLLLHVPNRHHSNLFGVFRALRAMSCFVCLILLFPLYFCFFAKARGKCLLAKTKKHHCQHLQA